MKLLSTILVASLVILTTIAHSSESDDSMAIVEKAIKLYEGGKEQQEQAISLFLQAAEAGNARAHFYLGQAHFTGKGVVQDEEKAIDWHKKAAKLGKGESSMTLAVTYLSKKNTKEAVKWLRMGSDQEVQLASQTLGEIYFSGHEDIEPDFEEANKLFRLSAEQGSLQAKIYLAINYLNGLGVEKNLVKCNEWTVNAKSQAGSPNSSATSQNNDMIKQLLDKCPA